MKKYKERIDILLKNKYYMISMIIIAIISFGFSITHLAIDIDDLEGNRYLGEGNIMLSAGRFGMNFWAKIFGNDLCGPTQVFAIDVLAVIMLIAAAIQFCVLFQVVSKNRLSMTCCTLFSCLFISYPLINEIWQYNGANLCVCGGYFLTGLSIYSLNEVIENHDLSKKSKVLRIAFSLFCTTIICSSYESVASVYILVVFAMFFIRSFIYTKEEFPIKKIFTEGLFYALILAGGVLLRLIIHQLILLVFHIPLGTNGATTILWTIKPFIQVFKILFAGIIVRFGVCGLWNFPITVVLICFISFAIFVLITSIKAKDFRRFIAGFGMMLSLFILSIIQGCSSPYRTCQTYAVFSAFVLVLFYYLASKKKIIGKVFILALALLCINQSTFLNNIFATNYLRSENEIRVINNIGKDLCQCDYNSNVVFVGEIEMSDYLTDQIKIDGIGAKLKKQYDKLMNNESDGNPTIVDTNVNSVLNWSIISFDGESAEKLFELLGYDIDVEANKDIIEEAEAYVCENDTPCYPKNGYIVNQGDYVIVRLG